MTYNIIQKYHIDMPSSLCYAAHTMKQIAAGFCFELGGFRGAIFAVDQGITVPEKRAV